MSGPWLGYGLNELGVDLSGNRDFRKVGAGEAHRVGGLTFPKARSTESKYRRIPKRMKKIPNPVMPTPISATGKDVGGGDGCGK